MMNAKSFYGANSGIAFAPWAMEATALNALVDSFVRGESPALPDRAAMEHSRAELVRRVANSAVAGATLRNVNGLSVRQVGRVAILPMYGLIVQRPGLVTRYGFGTSTEQFAAAHRELVADPSVAAIGWKSSYAAAPKSWATN